ncbi:hypothetical protein O3P69_000183 [Scylla paramamosain]|uniref:Uncharacterized protein n=1 Tax=Scylla paramamosain TaxID=85552 RepID=A0AAW0UUX0_SCYPA
MRSKYKRGADITELLKFIRDAADEASDPVFGRLVNKEQEKDKGRNQQRTNTTYCTEELCDKLRAKGMTRQMELTTITQTRMPVESTVITLFVSDIHNKQDLLYTRSDCQAITKYRPLRSSLERDLSMLWELEGVNSEAPGMSQSDIKTLEIWDARKTIEDNHYTLPIPFKAERLYLADNRNMAEKRLRMLGKRLNKDNNLKEKYKGEMHKLLKKGYAVAAPPEDLNRADELINSIAEKEWRRSFTTLDINRDELLTDRALGMLWEIESDCLKVDVQVKNHHKRYSECLKHSV